MGSNNYGYMSHLERQENVDSFTRLYLRLTLREQTAYEHKIMYEPRSMTFKLIIHLHIDGVYCSAGMDGIPEDCDGAGLTKAIEEVLSKCKEDYIKRMSENYNRGVYRGR